MKNQKKRIKSPNVMSDDQNEVRNFIIIIIVLLVIIGGIYLVSRLLTNKEDSKDQEPVAGSINYNTTLIGNMLNKPDDEYFVLIYDSKDIQSISYSGLASAYSENEDALPIYVADLNNELNKKYYDPENINANTTNFDKFKVGDITLLQISNKKIKKSYTKIEDIKEVLKKDFDEE